MDILYHGIRREKIFEELKGGESLSKVGFVEVQVRMAFNSTKKTVAEFLIRNDFIYPLIEYV